MGNALEKTMIVNDEPDMAIPNDEGVNIWIDKYSDVFSDFDTRPLTRRKLSNDLISEICKLIRENTTTQVELNFNILEEHRDIEVEHIITGHLKTHFTNNKKADNEIARKTTRLGYILTLTGFSIILLLAYVASIAKGVFFLNSLPVLVEPLAWFVTWTGLDHIFKRYSGTKTLDINSMMLDAFVSFSYMSEPAQETTPTAHKAKKVVPAGNNLRVI